MLSSILQRNKRMLEITEINGNIEKKWVKNNFPVYSLITSLNIFGDGSFQGNYRTFSLNFRSIMFYNFKKVNQYLLKYKKESDK